MLGFQDVHKSLSEVQDSGTECKLLEKISPTLTLALVKSCEGECSQHLLKEEDENLDISIKSNDRCLQMNWPLKKIKDPNIVQ